MAYYFYRFHVIRKVRQSLVLGRLELLLSEEELREFQRLPASGNFAEKNPSWRPTRPGWG